MITFPFYRSERILQSSSLVSLSDDIFERSTFSVVRLQAREALPPRLGQSSSHACLPVERIEAVLAPTTRSLAGNCRLHVLD